MTNNNSSPNLEDLLGISSSSEAHLNDSFQKEDISNMLPENITKEESSPVSFSQKGRLSRKQSKEDSVKKMSLDELLMEGEEISSASVHLNNIKKKESNEDQEIHEGNIFHQTFQEKTVSQEGLLENIENYADEKSLEIEGANKEKKRQEDPLLLMREKIEENWKERLIKSKKILFLSQGAIIFGILSLVGAFILFSFLLDTPTNGVRGNFVSSNYGIDLEQKEEKVKTLKQEKRELKKDIKKTEKVIIGFENNEVLGTIIEERIDWIKIIREINKVRCYADPVEKNIKQCLNDELSNKIILNPFSFENYTTKGGMKDGQIDVIISGKVHGSKGHIFQKISRLMQAFNDSKYFSGAEMRRYSKSQDSRLGFSMPFTMKLTYYKKGKGAQEEKK